MIEQISDIVGQQRTIIVTGTLTDQLERFNSTVFVEAMMLTCQGGAGRFAYGFDRLVDETPASYENEGKILCPANTSIYLLLPRPLMVQRFYYNTLTGPTYFFTLFYRFPTAEERKFLG